MTKRSTVSSALTSAALAATMLFPAFAAHAADPPQPGATAPNFTLPSQEDKPISLSQFKGKWVVLYFYPKDETQGCTIEAHNFQHDQSKYEASNAVVLGVSLDTVANHKAWCAKDTFSFKMLADPDHKVVDAYGVPVQTMNGESFAARQTFLISPAGKIVKQWTKVRPSDSSTEVLAELAEAEKK
jgi:peroxiredoxin Q/BCP